MTTLIKIVVIIAIISEIMGTILLYELVRYFKNKNEKDFRNNNNIQTKNEHQRKVGTNEQTTKKNIEPTNQRNNRE